MQIKINICTCVWKYDMFYHFILFQALRYLHTDIHTHTCIHTHIHTHTHTQRYRMYKACVCTCVCSCLKSNTEHSKVFSILFKPWMEVECRFPVAQHVHCLACGIPILRTHKNRKWTHIKWYIVVLCLWDNIIF